MAEYCIYPIEWTKCINPDAEVLIVGLTPGNSQNIESDNESMEAKKRNAFGGNMRSNLIKMLNHICVNDLLQVNCACELWNDDNYKADFTSVLEDATYVLGRDGSETMLNHLRDLNRSASLSKEFEKFKNDIQKYKSLSLIITCGVSVYKTVFQLQKDGLIPSDVTIVCIPHPSGSNGEAVSAFLDNNNLRKKTSSRKRETAWEMYDKAICKIENIISKQYNSK